jgi:hypothetical protein
MSISGVGGAIDNAGNLTVNNCSFISNKATGAAGDSMPLHAAGTGNGGAIFSETTETLMITGSTFSANIATGGNGTGTGPVPLGSTGAGGGIFNEGTGTVMITNSTVSGNQGISGSPSAFTGVSGGGLATGGAKISENFGLTQITNVTFAGNQAIGGTGGTPAGIALGGAIYVDDASVTLTGTLLSTITPRNCDVTAGTLTAANLAEGLKGWINHAEKIATSLPPSFAFVTSTSVERFTGAPLDSANSQS